jgi:TonB family protein
MIRAFGILLLAPLGLCLVAADINGLLASARAAQRQGNLVDAQADYESAFELALKEPAQRLTATAAEVATFYSRQNKVPTAVEVLKRAVDAEDQASVPLIKEVTLFLSLADLYSRERRLDDEAAVLKRVVQTWESASGPDSAIVANVLYRLSNAQQQGGNLTDAEQSIKRAIGILEKTNGENSAATGHALSLFSNIEKKLGNADAATTASDRVTAIQQKQQSTPVERVGKLVSAPRIVSKQDPPYSEKARKARLQGSILLSLVVDESGSPQNITILLPLGDGLDEEALEAVSKWRFQPGMKEGAPVSVQATIEVSFRLL